MANEFGPLRRVAIANRAEEEVFDVWHVKHEGENRFPLTDAYARIMGSYPFPWFGKSTSANGYFNALRLFAIMSRGDVTPDSTFVDMHTAFERFLTNVWLNRTGGVIPVDLAHFASDDALIVDNMVISGLWLGGVTMDAHFDGAKADRIKFAQAMLTAARFSGATLSRINFRGTSLEGADFSGAILRDIDFRGANLLGAKFYGATFAGRIRFSKETKVRLEDLLRARESGPAVAEYRRVFGNGDNKSTGGRTSADRHPRLPLSTPGTMHMILAVAAAPFLLGTPPPQFTPAAAIIPTTITTTSGFAMPMTPMMRGLTA
jgi:hypothetical protein